jgi:hypothetical protein
MSRGPITRAAVDAQPVPRRVRAPVAVVATRRQGLHMAGEDRGRLAVAWTSVAAHIPDRRESMWQRGHEPGEAVRQRRKLRVHGVSAYRDFYLFFSLFVRVKRHW